MNGLCSTPKYRLTLFFLLIISLISGCIDLSGSRSTYTNKATTRAELAYKSTHCSFGRGNVHTMRGGLGIFSIGMNQLRDSVVEQYRIPAYSTMWYNAGHVTRFIINRYYTEQDHGPIILVGHSLGANEQIKVARNLNEVGIPVALLITIDAVSQTIVPPNVQHALNIYKPGFVPMFSGLKLKAVDPRRTYIENINAGQLKGISVNHFTIDKDGVVHEIMLDRIKKVLSNGKCRGN
jgi:hypothetical protein